MAQLVVQLAGDAAALGVTHGFLLAHQAAQHLVAAGQGLFDLGMGAPFGLQLLLE